MIVMPLLLLLLVQWKNQMNVNNPMIDKGVSLADLGWYSGGGVPSTVSFMGIATLNDDRSELLAHYQVDYDL